LYNFIENVRGENDVYSKTRENIESHNKYKFSFN